MSGTAAGRTSNRVQIPQFGIDVYDRLVYFSPFDRAVLEGSFWSAKNQLATFLSPPPRKKRSDEPKKRPAKERDQTCQSSQYLIR